MGMLGIPMLLAPALGPVLSGWLVEYVSWHWIFLINLPIGILGVFLSVKYLPKTEKKAAPHLDLIGMILAPIAFASLAYGVNQGGGNSWSSTGAIWGLAVGGTALVLFIFVELSHKHPLLELRVFRSSDFTRGIILSWVTQAALFGSMLFVPLYLQQVRGYTPLETGLILLPQALSSGIGMPLGGRLFDKIGARPLAFVGLSIISTALYLLSGITVDTSLPVIMMCLALMGLGMGLTMMPVNTHVLNSAPREWVGRVTPLTTAAQQVVVSFAVAGMTGYLTSQIAVHMGEIKQGSNPLVAAVQGFNDVFLLAAFIAGAGILLSLILRKPKVASLNSSKEVNKPDPAMMIGH